MTKTVRTVKRERRRVVSARKKARALSRALAKLLDGAGPRLLSPLAKVKLRAVALTDARARFEKLSPDTYLSSETPAEVLERLEDAIREAHTEAQESLGSLGLELDP